MSGERLSKQCEVAVVGGDPVYGDDCGIARRIPFAAMQPATVDRHTDRAVGIAHCAVHPPSMV
jgi:hypothetical protein